MRHSTWLIILGLLLAIAGVLTILHPFPASLTIELFAGWSFLILGVVQMVNAFRARQSDGMIWLLLLGVAMALLGVALLRNPIAGLVGLTVIAAMAFIASGIFKLISGWALERNGLGWGVLLSGVISLALGIMVLVHIMPSAAILLGVLLGIELLTNGFALLFVGLLARSA